MELPEKYFGTDALMTKSMLRMELRCKMTFFQMAGSKPKLTFFFHKLMYFHIKRVLKYAQVYVQLKKKIRCDGRCFVWNCDAMRMKINLIRQKILIGNQFFHHTIIFSLFFSIFIFII